MKIVIEIDIRKDEVNVTKKINNKVVDKYSANITYAREFETLLEDISLFLEKEILRSGE